MHSSHVTIPIATHIDSTLPRDEAASRNVVIMPYYPSKINVALTLFIVIFFKRQPITILEYVHSKVTKQVHLQLEQQSLVSN